MLKIKAGFVLRTIANQTIAVPIGQRTSDIHGVISLSESGELLWNALKDGAEIETLADILTENYEVERETALADVEKFVSALKTQGALE